MKKLLNLIFLFLFFFTNAQNPYFDISKQMEIYNDVLKTLSMNYIDDINFGDVMQQQTKKMLNGLDRFTTFYDEQGMLEVRMRQNGHYGGLGINVRIKDSLILVTSIHKDTPAAKQGLKVGDKIVAIEGKKVSELSNKVASNILKGPKGSSVHLAIERNGKTIQKTIERDDIVLDAVTATRIIDGNIGYIRFVKFNKKAAQQVKSALLDLKTKGAQKLIIDVRGNPGGLLNEVIKIVNFFIPKGKLVVKTKGRFKKYNTTFKTRNESIDEEIPIVILTNDRSASASEILSGSLQDYDRALIVGDTTYGKGLVQRTFNLKYGTYMKQTTSKYYIPSGRLIQKIDYWHRDKKNKPLRMSDTEKKKSFKTKGGRTVYNFGGVIPDVVVDDKIKSEVVKDLLKKNYIFDYATWYYFNKPKPQSVADFQLTDKDFNMLIDYLGKHQINPQTTAEKILRNAYKKAKKERLSKELEKRYNALFDAYNQADEQDMKMHKNLILDLISKDLVVRYFYSDGYVDYMLKTDKTIRKAKELLNDLSRYNKLLKKK